VYIYNTQEADYILRNNNTEPTTETEKEPSPYPLQVLYCEICSLPPEYCRYTPKFNKCKPWLLKYAPAIYADLEKTGINNSNVDVEHSGEEDVKKDDDIINDEDDKKDDGTKFVGISAVARNKKKSITTITGLQEFGISLADASKALRQKFACGANPVKGKDAITMNGNVEEEIVEFILDKWGESIKIRNIYFVATDGSKTPATLDNSDD